MKYILSVPYNDDDNGYQSLRFTQNRTLNDTVVLAEYPGDVHYEWDMMQSQPLTFKPKTSGYFSFSGTSSAGIGYMIVPDSADTFVGLTAQTLNGSVYVKNDEKIYWYFHADAHVAGSPLGTFSSSTEFDISGNLASLVYATNFIAGEYEGNWYPYDNYPSGKASTYFNDYFKYLFKGCKVVNSFDLYNSCQKSNTSYSLTGVYYGMFQDCTLLKTTSKNLSTDSYGSGTCQYMYANCTSLKKASIKKLYTSTAVNACYGMYSGCTSLETAEVPKIGTLSLDYSYNTYSYMFDGCVNLRKVTTYFSEEPKSGLTTNWLRNVAPAGVYVRPSGLTWDSIGVHSVPEGWTMVDSNGNVVPHYKDMYITLQPSQSGTFSYRNASTKYSLDSGATWTTLASDTSTPTVSAGSKIMFKANLTSNSGGFSSTVPFKAFGNVLSLKYGDNFSGKTEINSSTGGLSDLFQGASITSAEYLLLPSTINVASGFSRMFWACSSLTKAPKLPASAVTEYCCYEMFAGCTGLTAAPSMPAMSLENYCYGHMFEGCTSLATVPRLPATATCSHCYDSMFKGCTSLREIQIGDTVSSSGGFVDITMVDHCCDNMLSGCTSMTTIENMFTHGSPDPQQGTHTTNPTMDWIIGVPTTGGTFICSSRGWTNYWSKLANNTPSDGYPASWTINNQAP